MAIGNTCVHYNGRIFRKDRCCNVDIDPVISYLGGDTFDFLHRAPCFRSNADAPLCHLQKFMTDEEIEAAQVERTAHIERFRTFMPVARQAIIATGLRGGTIDCPQCSGSMRFSVASNGHVHAQCGNEGCKLGWME